MTDAAQDGTMGEHEYSAITEGSGVAMMAQLKRDNTPTGLACKHGLNACRQRFNALPPAARERMAPGLGALIADVVFQRSVEGVQAALRVIEDLLDRAEAEF